MASKHAALYFEAYKQHHLVCSSLHTLSLARCPEFKVAVVMDERIPASSTSSESKAKGMCNKAELANCKTTTASRQTVQILCTVQTTPCCIALSCKCSLYYKTTGTGHHLWL